VTTRVLRAKWILPVDRPPIDGGWIAVDHGRVASVGGGRPPATAENLGDVAVLPGLVNAHTHLELGWLAGRVPAMSSIVEWIRTLIRERSTGPPEGDAGIVQGIERGIQEARATGTVLVGDISNTLAAPPVLDANGFASVTFHEILGFNAHDPDGLVRQAWERVDRVSSGGAGVVAHAPYSVSPALFRSIAGTRRHVPLSVHLGESAEETEFLLTGTGPFRELLEELGAWDDSWDVPRCDPVEYLKRVDYLSPGCLVVHGVHLSVAALERLRDEDAVVVTCPRSNEWVGAGMPPISHFYGSGVRVAVGTDSLASVGSLSVFDELAALRRIAPEVSAASLLESATRIGAEALGQGHEFGTIAAGRRAAFVTVRLPTHVIDVEEYLVGGVPADDIHPITC
jgi:cytosine/adenosine deaminase-related metal-dependent hydrolase